VRLRVTADRVACKHIDDSRNAPTYGRQPILPERPTVDDAAVPEIGEYGVS
jgi:hypothetical protein